MCSGGCECPEGNTGEVTRRGRTIFGSGLSGAYTDTFGIVFLGACRDLANMSCSYLQRTIFKTRKSTSKWNIKRAGMPKFAAERGRLRWCEAVLGQVLFDEGIYRFCPAWECGGVARPD